ncbi:g780 [Coccomyxa viridis]|uniref:Prolyl endopeptidase n=1 Tax=Coccomyxa viridis TaxID=1274662 RepID=A0ABP1FLW3_9CHLO
MATRGCAALSCRAGLLLIVSAFVALRPACAVNSTVIQGAVQGGISVLPSLYPYVYRDNVTNTFFGTEVADPYRWLENTDSNETLAFVRAQNNLTQQVLSTCDTRSKFKALMTEMYNFPKISCPFQRGEAGGVLRWYYSGNSGLQAQSVLFTTDAPDATGSSNGNPQVVLDPNTFSTDGTVALGDYAFSWDGRYIAYSISSGGSDWQKIMIKEINPDGTSTLLNDTLSNVKFSNTAWAPDNKGFFYNQYPAPNITRFGERGQNTGANTDQQLWYHEVGTSQDLDIFVLALPEQPTYSISASFTYARDYMLITISTGTAPSNKLWYMETAQLPKKPDGGLDMSSYDLRSKTPKPLPLVKFIDTFEAAFGLVANNGSIWTINTDLDAPRSKIVRTNITENMDPHTWTEILPQHEKDILTGSTHLKGDALLITYMRDVASVLQLRSLATGALVRELPMPGYGSVKEVCGRESLSQMYYSYESMTDAGSTYTYDTATPSADPVHVSSIVVPGGYDLSTLNTTQVFVPSKDGKVKIPMFIVHRNDVKLDGSNTAYLYAYGGYGIVTEPTFSTSRAAYILAYAGIYAVAGIRGGGEYGKTWWEDGHLEEKQNSFDDFASCMQYLHDNKWTSPPKLTIQGGSNGGLLMGAILTQHPSMFGAVISQVGVYDMLRYQLFTIGHAWETEYGDPDNKTDFEYLMKYSPLHNVRVPAGTHQFPATMLTTADHDDRVVPLHSYKFISTLQYNLAEYPDSPQRNPLLLRVDHNAGHGGGKPTDMIINEYSDEYGFSAKATNSKWVLQKPSVINPPLAAAG